MSRSPTGRHRGLCVRGPRVSFLDLDHHRQRRRQRVVTTASWPAGWKISLDGSDEWPTVIVQGLNGSLTLSGHPLPAAADGHLLDRRSRSGARGAPNITTALSVLVLPEDLRTWTGDDDGRVGRVRWSDPPPPRLGRHVPGPAACGHQRWGVRGPRRRGNRGRLRTRVGDAVVVTSQQVRLSDREQAAVTALRVRGRSIGSSRPGRR